MKNVKHDLLKIYTCWCIFFPKNKLDQLQFSIERLIKSNRRVLNRLSDGDI